MSSFETEKYVVISTGQRKTWIVKLVQGVREIVIARNILKRAIAVQTAFEIAGDGITVRTD